MSAAQPVLYLLHCGNLYGTERMALTTLAALGEGHRPVIVAPAGPIHGEAARLGLQAQRFDSVLGMVALLARWFIASPRLAVISTTVKFSLICVALKVLTRRRLHHLHIVHGGSASDGEAYGQKHRLNNLDVTVIAVSHPLAERLVAHRVRPDKIVVIENFLADAQRDAAPRRQPSLDGGVRDWVLVARLDPLKRVDLLLDALDRHPRLRSLRFTVLGDGPELETLRQRAETAGHPVRFAGFVADVPRRLAQAQGLLHTCPVETFGLVVLEGMAAGLPVLVPDRGGTAALVSDGVEGLLFAADDADSLAMALERARDLSAAALAAMVARADARLRERWSQAACIRRYRSLLAGGSPDALATEERPSPYT